MARRAGAKTPHVISRAASQDAKFMAVALALAKRGQGRVAPNPMVGAVIVKGGRVIARGWHHRYGADHAEVDALKRAGARARGATLYVNLEPCNRHGHVPPCTEAILQAGIKRVVVGVKDNHSKGRGGIARLRRAGIRVDAGVLEEQARALNERFFTYTQAKRPHTIVKMAATLDGKVATAAGDTRWITSEPARRRVHQMRAEADAVAVGIGTVLADDPELTVRLAKPRGEQPSPVVLDSRLRLPPAAKLLKTKTPRKFVVCSTRAPAAKRKHLEAAGVIVVAVKGARGGLDLHEAWRELGKRGVSSLLVEGGPRLAWQVVAGGLCDRLALFYAPKLLGCAKAPVVFSGGAAEKLSDAVTLEETTVERIGPDFLVTGKPRIKK